MTDARRDAQIDEYEPEDLSPNEIVARNLRAARELRDWTQDEAAEQLEPYLGKRWTKAAFSAAERSGRSFDADEIFAFALAFKLPVLWFLLPPHDDDTGTAITRVHEELIDAQRVIDMLLLAEEAENRVREILKDASRGHLDSRQRKVRNPADAWLALYVEQSLGEISDARRRLEGVVDMFQDLERAAESARAGDDAPRSSRRTTASKRRRRKV